MNNLVLRIQRLDEETGWLATWLLDSAQMGSTLRIDGKAAEETGRLGKDFLRLFENHGVRPLVDAGRLRAFGHLLFDQWFKPVWADIAPKLDGGRKRLLIQSTDRDILNLPWELVELTADLPVGCDAGWCLWRTPLERLRDGTGGLAPGPVRMLFLAAAPLDQVQLDYEREEERILGAMSGIDKCIFLPPADSGGLAELADLVTQYRPHVVHLSGHGKLEEENGTGTFAFEDERGKTDSVEAGQIFARAFSGNDVRCVFFNGCQTAQAAVGGLCQAFVAAGVPLVIGWSASVADDLATLFSEVFYRQLAMGETVSFAAARARLEIRDKGTIKRDGVPTLQDATFALPQVYTSVGGDAVYDEQAPAEAYTGARIVRELLPGGVKGLKEGYVGRRREGQRLIPALRDGDVTFAVLTGLGGAGKSTLATRAAQALRAAGFRVVACRVGEGSDPAAQGRAALTKLIDVLDRAFIEEKHEDVHKFLTNGELPLDERLRMLVDKLNEVKFLLVVDNFESALDVKTRRIVDPELGGFYRFLAENLTGQSRVVVTCRYLPADTPGDLATLLHLPLPDFPEHDFLKFMRRDKRVEQRIANGELTRELLSRLYGALGGTPRFLEQARKLLEKADVNGLLEELDGQPGMLAKARAEYVEKVIISRLYQAMGQAARRMVSRLAISELPLPVEAVCRIVSVDESAAIEGMNAGVNYALLQRFELDGMPDLYHPPGLLREWLCDGERVPEADALDVHRELAAFWRECFEADREADLRVSIELELTTCRFHARQGGDVETFRWATIRTARRLERFAEWREALHLLNEIEEANRNGETWLAIASVEDSLGEWKLARDHLGQASDLLDEGTQEKAAAWHNLATIDLNEGNYAAAREKCGKALIMLQSIGDRAGEAATLHQLATIDVREGHYPAARVKFEKSLAISQSIGQQTGEAATWHNLATIDLNEGNYAAAREKSEKSLAIKQVIGNRAGEAVTWHQLATIDLREGNYTAAREKLGKALAMRQSIGDRAGEAATWHQLATIDLNEGNYAAARAKFEKSLAIKQSIGDRAGEAATWYQLGAVACGLGHGESGARLVAICWMIDRAIGHGDTENDFKNLCIACGNLGYSQEQFNRMLAEVAESFRQDRGQEMLRKAFEGV